MKYRPESLGSPQRKLLPSSHNSTGNEELRRSQSRQTMAESGHGYESSGSQSHYSEKARGTDEIVYESF